MADFDNSSGWAYNFINNIMQSGAAQGVQQATSAAGTIGSGIAGTIKDVVSPPTVNDDSLFQRKYDFKSTTFPLDLGSTAVGHYMVININVPVYRSNERRRGAYAGGRAGNILSGEYSKVDVLRFGKGSDVAGSIGSQREFFSLPRNTRRIQESIALFMPSSIVFTQQNAYEDISLTAIAGSIGVGALSKFGTIIGGAIGAAVGSTVPGVGTTIGGVAGAGLGAGFGALTSGLGQVIGTASKLAGYPINPRVEILFATSPQRQFVFEVLMAPRNAAESEAIKAIVQTLRFHAAPEIDSATSGLTFIPPAEFDITFFNKGVEQVNIPRINTCVLNRLDVDYSPTGVYSTFMNGHPVAVRLSMAFTEIEILHKTRITQGF